MSKVAALAIFLFAHGALALTAEKQVSKESKEGPSLVDTVVLSLQDSAEATYKSFVMIGIAELFDKTWFVALLMALKYDKGIVFWGCFSALAAHTVIAAVLGYSIARLVPITYLHFGAAAANHVPSLW